MSEIGKLATDIAELKRQKTQESTRVGVAIVPINTHGKSLTSIETEIVQILARGRKASVDEGRIAALLDASLAESAATEWAEQMAARYEVTWSRRQRFGLLFELVKAEIDLAAIDLAAIDLAAIDLAETDWKIR